MARVMFHHDLEKLFSDMLRIGAMVETALNNALKSLQSHDTALALEVINADRELNRQVQELHSRALLLIATQAPMASDLRLIGMIIATLPELERMGDHAVTVAKTLRRIDSNPDCMPLNSMPGPCASIIFDIGERVQKMLHEGVLALDRRDRSFADRAPAMDDEVDHLYAQLFRETVAFSRQHPEHVDEALHLLRLAHDLERIGDRVTNLAEQIVFLHTGSLVEINT
jgi:phosphate transport system protein